jgi:hypothetical protein
VDTGTTDVVGDTDVRVEVFAELLHAAMTSADPTNVAATRRYLGLINAHPFQRIDCIYSHHP